MCPGLLIPRYAFDILRSRHFETLSDARESAAAALHQVALALFGQACPCINVQSHRIRVVWTGNPRFL